MTPEQLFEQNQRLAYFVIRRMPSTLIAEPEDMEQDALMGLWHACQRFDESKGYTFSTYAYRCISGFILNGVRQRTGKNPPPMMLDSLDVSVGGGGWNESLGSQLPDRELDIVERIVIADEVEQRLAELPSDLDREVVMASLERGGIARIAEREGVSAQAISSRRRRAMRRLRERAGVAA